MHSLCANLINDDAIFIAQVQFGLAHDYISVCHVAIKGV
jgi:hypothetical protein